MEKKVIWFMKGYSNLFHAIANIKDADISGNFKVLCSHDNQGFIGFESSDFAEVEPKGLTDKEFILFCEDIIKKYNVSVIFAANKQYLLNKNKNRFKELGAEIVTATNYKMIDTINNKGKLYNYLKDNGVVKIPDFSIFKNVKEFNLGYKLLKEKHEQLCMKPLRGVYGKGFYVLKEKTNQMKNTLNQSQTIGLSTFRKTITGKTHAKMMVMQFLNEVERSVDCVAINGKLIAGVIRKKIGGNLPQVIEDNPEIMKQTRFLTEKLKLNGLFNIQFKDCDGEHYLLEINPRLSGRSYYATLAGVNLPYIASLVFSGLKKSEEIKVETNYDILISAVNFGIVVKNHKIEKLSEKIRTKNTKESK